MDPEELRCSDAARLQALCRQVNKETTFVLAEVRKSRGRRGRLLGSDAALHR